MKCRTACTAPSLPVNRPSYPRADRQRGFSLIEILVTLVIIAFGLLGVAGLQATALRTTVESTSRSMAVRMANDMADRLRLEPLQVAAYIAAAAADQTQRDSSACYGASGCQGADRVAASVGEWQRLLDARLPGGQGIVCRDASPQDGTGRATAGCSGGANDPLVIKVFWRARALEAGAANNGTLTLSFATVVMP